MRRVARVFFVAFALVVCACSPERGEAVRAAAPSGVPQPEPTEAGTPPPKAATPQPAKATPRTPKPRVVTEQSYTPFASVGGVTLRHPSRRVERVGFHQSNHEGA